MIVNFELFDQLDWIKTDSSLSKLILQIKLALRIQ